MRDILVSFISRKLKDEYISLKESKFEDKQLYDFISRAINDLKKNPMCGVKIPKKLWPKKYVKEYEITNLWKHGEIYLNFLCAKNFNKIFLHMIYLMLGD